MWEGSQLLSREMNVECVLELELLCVNGRIGEDVNGLEVWIVFQFCTYPSNVTSHESRTQKGAP